MTSSSARPYDISVQIEWNKPFPDNDLANVLRAVVESNEGGNEPLLEIYGGIGGQIFSALPLVWLNISNVPHTARLAIRRKGQVDPLTCIDLNDLRVGQSTRHKILDRQRWHGELGFVTAKVDRETMFDNQTEDHRRRKPFIIDCNSSNRNQCAIAKFFDIGLHAQRIQLPGPLPEKLKHKFDGSRKFVSRMFNRQGTIGKFMSWVSHKLCDHMYGGKRKEESEPTIDDASPPSSAPLHTGHVCDGRSPLTDNRSTVQQFLEMVNNGHDKKVFTFVVTLNAELRFVEKKKGKVSNLLSKHAILSDVAETVGFAGEFFIRQQDSTRQDHSSPNISDIEMVIDNDSGTYRPSKDILQNDFLRYIEAVLPGLKIIARDYKDDELRGWKKIRRS